MQATCTIYSALLWNSIRRRQETQETLLNGVSLPWGKKQSNRSEHETDLQTTMIAIFRGFN